MKFEPHTPSKLLELSTTQKWPHLYLTYDSERGTGVAASIDIPKGSVICDYAGEIYLSSEANRYLSHLSPEDENHARSYAVEFTKPYGGDFFVLAHFPEAVTSYGRLINHSRIHPNCRVCYKAIKTHTAKRGVTNENFIVAVETTRKICQGEELLWNYGPKYSREDWFDKCFCKKCVVEGRYYKCSKVAVTGSPLPRLKYRLTRLW